MQSFLKHYRHEFEYMIDHGGRSIVEAQGLARRDELQLWLKSSSTSKSNGVPMKARKGEMIIRVTDAHGAYVPRFCYHDKLSIAANCRMCLVEVEKAPKPLPACATPVAEGMKIFTQSPRAIGAQRATMEFLLINHPLDCPICDQGGECELQDLAVGFGRDISRFPERKRVVHGRESRAADRHRHDALHPVHPLHPFHRGDRRHPGAGHDRARRGHEGARLRRADRASRTVRQHHRPLSGGRAGLQALPLHGARLGDDLPCRWCRRTTASARNLFGHVLRGKLMRVVPRENEAINETWIADRDRFSYEGVYRQDD